MKTLSENDYLKALALFTMANKHYLEMTRYRTVLEEHLGVDEYGLGHIDDAMCDLSPDFDLALAKQDFQRAPTASEGRGE